jgi:acetyl-CoA acetyltransferase
LPRRILDRIRAAIRYAAYDVTAHAIEEMAEDALDVVDVETAILKGRLVKTDRDDPRGTRYTVHGIGANGITPVGTVGRFTGTGRYLIITAYEIMEPRV